MFPILLILLLPVALQAAAAPMPEGRQARLTELLLEDCGACHGRTLRGGLGPALTARALEGRDPETLFLTIRDGRPGTAMPPWGPYLKEEEIRWLVEQLQRGAIHAR
ncbi:MAG: cytochrome c [Gammaproteobacteria bacterium]|nr:MAG: cytochrome c [Gammaproteobacteria bacterium]